MKLPHEKPHVKVMAFATRLGLRDRLRAAFTGRLAFVVHMKAPRWMPPISVTAKLRVGNGMAVGHTKVRAAVGRDAAALVAGETFNPDEPSGSAST